MELHRNSPRATNSRGGMNSPSTIEHPNIKGLAQAVAMIIHEQLIVDNEEGKEIPKGTDLYFFCEEKYLDMEPDSYDEMQRNYIKKLPSEESIFDFILSLYSVGKFSPQTCVVSLVYINRLVAFTGFHLYPTNWRPILLCSILVAQKFLDDKYVTNAVFADLYPFFTTAEINKLEGKFLQLL